MPAASHLVTRGDTLYAIAIGHGLNYLDLAAWNNITPPYIIQPGQLLRLAAPAGMPTRAAAIPAAPATRPPVGRQISPPLGSGARRSGAARSTRQTRPRRTITGRATTSLWQWPAAGTPLPADRHGGAAAGRGIHIGGRSGQEVRAAAAGEVVHSGPLKHYGKLIILRHRGEYLSVYGYNSELLVAEGEQVDASQLIARMGLSPAGEPVLHFEIILPDGEPADPRKYLPAQQSSRAGSQG